VQKAQHIDLVLGASCMQEMEAITTKEAFETDFITTKTRAEVMEQTNHNAQLKMENGKMNKEKIVNGKGPELKTMPETEAELKRKAQVREKVYARVREAVASEVGKLEKDKKVLLEDTNKVLTFGILCFMLYVSGSFDYFITRS
jgi:hypothetical protein